MQYPNIDIPKTAKQIKYYIQKSGYTVKQIQEYLCLSCPQPIYRWMKGQMLPPIDHFYALSKLLGVSMELLIVEHQNIEAPEFEIVKNENAQQRMFAYCKYFCRVA